MIRINWNDPEEAKQLGFPSPLVLQGVREIIIRQQAWLFIGKGFETVHVPVGTIATMEVRDG